MRKVFQTEWQGIHFREFTEVSSKRVADFRFYDAFYREFFRRNKREGTWSDIPSWWRSLKDKVVDLVAERSKQGNQHTLSIGCGLGYVEKMLFSQGVGANLEVTETSDAPLRWLALEFPAERIHVGYFPSCLPPDARYDLIYLSTIDYCFNNSELHDFLLSVKERLNKDGRCLVISFSLQKETLISSLRSLLKNLAIALKLHDPGQLWGYLRTKAEYRKSMADAGFKHCVEGTLSDGSNYWIEGRIT